MAGKADIIDHIAEGADISKKEATDAFDAFLECVSSNLKNGERVQLPGFGSFSVSHRAARTGRNPATGAAIQIKASNGAKFKIGKDLKEALN